MAPEGASPQQSDFGVNSRFANWILEIPHPVIERRHSRSRLINLDVSRAHLHRCSLDIGPLVAYKIIKFSRLRPAVQESVTRLQILRGSSRYAAATPHG